jgi:O-antigen/teichoic acid export membrane protein
MQGRSKVEIADERSRKRAIIVAAAAIVFVVAQVMGGPLFNHGPDATAHHLTRTVMWSVNVVVLLLCLATGGGILNDREIRALVNDEVSRANYRTSVIAGFWVAMISSMLLYLIPAFAAIGGQDAIYIVVTLSVAIASLSFAYLELRAHRDA